MIDPNEVEGGTRGDMWDNFAVALVIGCLVVGSLTVAAHQLGITQWFISLFA